MRGGGHYTQVCACMHKDDALHKFTHAYARIRTMVYSMHACAYAHGACLSLSLSLSVSLSLLPPLSLRLCTCPNILSEEAGPSDRCAMPSWPTPPCAHRRRVCRHACRHVCRHACRHGCRHFPLGKTTPYASTHAGMHVSQYYVIIERVGPSPNPRLVKIVTRTRVSKKFLNDLGGPNAL